MKIRMTETRDHTVTITAAEIKCMVRSYINERCTEGQSPCPKDFKLRLYPEEETWDTVVEWSETVSQDHAPGRLRNQQT